MVMLMSTTNGGEDVWVSAPLRVHRRCDDPMFSISNDLAYKGIMVKGFRSRIEDPDVTGCFDLPDGYNIFPSFWADEPATVSGMHLQPKQIERLRNALDHLKKMGGRTVRRHRHLTVQSRRRQAAFTDESLPRPSSGDHPHRSGTGGVSSVLRPRRRP